MPAYVPGSGPIGHSDLMVIGEAPSRYDELTLEPFSGPAGDKVKEYLQAAGVSPSDVYFTYVSKYQAPMGDFSKLHLIGVDIQEQIRDLDAEIKRINPNCILVVGNEALAAVCGISISKKKSSSTKKKKPLAADAEQPDEPDQRESGGILLYRGSIVTAKDGFTKCVATIHPAALFSRGDAAGLPNVYGKLIQADIERACIESRTKKLRLPDRHLVVASNSLDLFRFAREYENLDKACVDIESINCIPVCVGFAFSRHHAISVPLLPRVGNVKLTDMSMSELIECWRIIDKLLRRCKLIGHNLKYDNYKLSRLGFEFPDVYSDTLIKTRVIFPELPTKGLATAASIWTREPYYKEEGKEFKLGKSKLSQLFLYNAKDCAVNFEVDEEQEKDLIELGENYKIPLLDYYYNYQMKKHPIYLEMENNGFAVDMERKRDLKIKYVNLRQFQHERLTKLIGHEVNVKSAPQKIMLFKELGLPVYQKAPTSEDSIVKMLGNHCKGKDAAKKKDILEGILEETRIRDQESRYINFVPDYDGRCKSSFNIIATETCRSSTSVPKKPIRPAKSGLAFHTISKHGRLAKDIRSMFIPDKGKVFVQADSSQAEARVVAVLSRDFELLTAFDTIDIHRRTAGLILGMTNNLDLSVGAHITDSIGKDSAERFCGKKTRHAGNYDMKKRRFMTEFNTDAQKFEIDMSISEWKGGQMLEFFHAASPKIKNVFHAEIQEIISNTRTLIDPCGGIRIFNGVMDDSLFQEAYANLPQRTVSHLVQGAAIMIHEELGDEIGLIGSGAPINWISENHDSLLYQCPESYIDSLGALIKKHMTRAIDFSLYCSMKRDIQLVIPCDLEVTDQTYGDLMKVSKYREMQATRLSEPAVEISKLSMKERMDIIRGTKPN